MPAPQPQPQPHTGPRVPPGARLSEGTILELLGPGPVANVFVSCFSDLFLKEKTCSRCNSRYTSAGNLGGACGGGRNHNNDKNKNLFVPAALLPIFAAAGSRLAAGVPRSIRSEIHGPLITGLVFLDT